MICPIEAILVICSYFQAISLMNQFASLFIISVDGIINQRAKKDEHFLIPQTSFKLHFHWRRSAPPPSVNITSERSVLTHLRTHNLTRGVCSWHEIQTAANGQKSDWLNQGCPSSVHCPAEFSLNTPAWKFLCLLKPSCVSFLEPPYRQCCFI